MGSNYKFAESKMSQNGIFCGLTIDGAAIVVVADIDRLYECVQKAATIQSHKIIKLDGNFYK